MALNQPIILSTAVSDNKATTHGFKVTELILLRQLQRTMNREAVASGLFSNGHRHHNHLRAMGNIYFIDIDTPPYENEAPYYQTIEAKLKTLNISFVSVPSKSADKYPYKRHIAIVLDSHLPTGKKAYKETAQYILNAVGIDLNKIDNRVAFNTVAFLAPASINKNFSNYDEVSSLNFANPLAIPKHLQSHTDKLTTAHNDIKSNHLVKFADGSILSAYDAKKLISKGDSKLCYCPAHTDNNPSATFYHNSNGSIKIFCGKCEDVFIAKDFIPKEPTTPHNKYNYSIVIDDAPNAKIKDLTSKIGNYSHRTEKSVIWAYSVQCMGDIYQLLLAKVYLVQKGFSVSPNATGKKHDTLLRTSTLHPITKNITLPTPYIPKGVATSEHFYRYKQIARYVFEHYIFVEATIYATYQNIIAPSRTFSDTCDLGLAYFEYMLKVMQEQEGLKQSSKQYPMRLQGKAKTKLTEQRRKNMATGTETKITARQKKILKLKSDGKYLHPNGKPNITAMAKKLGVSTRTLHRDYMQIIKRE